MTDHSGLLDRYRRMREVRLRLNNHLVKMIPRTALEECGRILGFFRKGVLFFDTEDERRPAGITLPDAHVVSA